MPEDSQEAPLEKPDPSILTTEQMLLAIQNLEKLTDLSDRSIAKEVEIQFKAWQREMDLRESHRKELKEDSRTFTEAIRVSQETAVNAALAAAEKARDKESTVTQLANDKTALSNSDQLKLQGDRFSADIANATAGVNEVKTMIRELQAEKRGGKELALALYGFVGFLIGLLVLGGFVAASGAFSR